ncbi:MAG: 30S ribosomal protein S2, partial [Proteobacteria bacterium]|nr:30S ribosomal protein S2 [Pseudomonadota bacterium]
MTLPAFSMRELLEAGVHFGHQTHRWNPKMGPYIYGTRNKIHIIDLSQTMPHLYRALQFVRDTVAGGGRVLFVGTKRQASQPIAEAAKRCGQFYVNHRWLGGMLTNWQTISKSIKRLKELDAQLESDEALGLTKKEMLQLTRQQAKLERALGGIREMGGLPDLIFVIDTNREEIAVHEANNLKIPVVAVLDTNCNPDGIAFPIPGNDDATRAIKLFCDLVSATVLDGIQEELKGQGVDTGAAETAPAEPAAAKAAEEKPKGKAEAEKTAEKAKDADAKDKDEKKAEPAKKEPAKKAEKPEDKAGDEKATDEKTADKTADKTGDEPKKAAAKKTDDKADDKAGDKADEKADEKADKAPKSDAKDAKKPAAKKDAAK